MSLRAGPTSLRARASLLFLAGVLATGLGFLFLLVSLTRGWLVKELDDRMRSVGVATADHLRVPLAFGDRIEIAAAASALLKESDVVGVAVLDPSGRSVLSRAAQEQVWLRVWRAPAPTAQDIAPTITGRSGGPGSPQIREYVVPIRISGATNGADTKEADEFFGLVGSASPSAAARTGWLRVAVSTARVDRMVAIAVRAGLMVLLGAFMLALLAAGLLMRLVVRPLREADGLAHEIAEGNLSRRLPVRGNDELGSLAASLNRMADSLVVARRAAAIEAVHLRDSTRAVLGAARRARQVSDPQGAFDVVALQARSLTECDGAILAVPAAEGNGLVVEYRSVTEAAFAGLLRGSALPVPELSAAGAARGESNGDGTERPGARLDLDGDSPLALVLRPLGVRSAMALPLPRPEGPPSILLLLARTPSHFEDWQVDVVDALTSHLSSALHASQLRLRLEGAFAELERTRDSLVRAQNLRLASEMASGAAHDFNNVLGAILGRAQLLRRQSLAGELAPAALVGALGVIENAAKDGSETVRRLREFGRTRDSARTESVDLESVMRDAVEFTRSRWEDESQARGVTIRVAIEAEPGVCVLAQPTELREVFTNLMLNAIDALSDGGTIRLAARAVGDRALLTFADDGVGMNEDVKHRIFEPFFTTKGTRGTGLGLSVVYGIVQRTGGTIEVETAPDQGTRFALSFPLSANTTVHVAEAAPLQTATVFDPLEILIVDDEEPVRDLLVDIAEALGHRTTSFESPLEVAATFTPSRYNLVLTDIGMPDMNGWQLTKIVRAVDPSVVIALVTGWGEEIDAGEVQNAGANAVVAKPFTIEDLSRVFELAQARRRERRAA
jgi:signal transduction histidine kinase/ActR/RegA family two-component response regulator